MRAGDFAQQNGHGAVLQDHLLWAVIAADDSAAHQVLEACGAPVTEVIRRLEELLHLTIGQTGQRLVLTQEAKQVIDAAYDEARAIEQRYIGTEHVFLAVCGQNAPGVAILREYHVELASLRAVATQLVADGRRLER